MRVSFNGSGLILVTTALLMACAPARFQTVMGSGDGSNGSSSVGKIVERFDQAQGANKVDILIVNDNSASMGDEQSKLGQRFGNFISEISDIDYQIGMTTTDIDSVNFNLDGRIIPWLNTGGARILTPSTPNQAASFQQTIVRPETSDCLNSGNCPSGNEQALGAMVRAISHRNGLNSGFFRADTPLAVFVLSDEDEMSTGNAGTTPAQVVSAFQAAFGLTKRLAVYGIVVQPGDLACRDEQRAQAGAQGAGYYATRVTALANLTGGKTMSICAPDYSQSLSEISREFRSLVTTYELSQVPVAASVEVIFTPAPAQPIGFTLNGRSVTLDRAAPLGTKIEVRYLAQ
jgi:hypothetical protein